MAIITLTTDWNFQDYYLGAVKGSILSMMADVNVIDINHQIPPFNTTVASFILKNSFHYFPAGTVHIVDVNSDTKDDVNYVAVEYEGHYFIGYDNGGLSLIFQNTPSKTISIEIFSSSKNRSFQALNIFVPAAIHLCSGKPIEDLGSQLTNLKTKTQLLPTIDDALITGTVLYFDSYQNAITNITKDLFEKIGKGRTFEIFIQSNRNIIRKISKSYQEVDAGELLAIFNVADLLEIAVQKGNVSDLLHLSIKCNYTN